MLSRYGEIYKCQNYHRTFGRYNKLKRTGDRIVWMKLREHIPQLLNIKNTEISSLYVKYQKQPFSCNICGHTGHNMWRCKRHSDGYKNIIDINDGCTRIDDDEDHDDDHISDISVDSAIITQGNLDNIDIHIDPSQNQNKIQV